MWRPEYNRQLTESSIETRFQVADSFSHIASTQEFQFPHRPGCFKVRSNELKFQAHAPIMAAPKGTSDYEADSQGERSEEKRVHKRKEAQRSG